jgi:hypothetical protein
VQSDATRTCELLVGLRAVTALGVDERLRQPLRSASTLSILDQSLYREPRKFR